MSRSKLDPTQITQMEHDEKSKAKRVKMVGTEMSIELDHRDGDSVTAHPAKLSASSLGVEASDANEEIIPPLDCSSIRKLQVHVEGSGNVLVQVSLSDSEDSWLDLGQCLQPTEVCARRVRVKSVNAQGDVHLVGRS